ncbi:SctD/MshK family protein [Yoonia sp. 2307UL14-13]|uniref:SctD/MshK family protein n=1 Tax=Yoonia sp. 2307UL14-13 TaxID=3126506 RepID=UPI0030A958EA
MTLDVETYRSFFETRFRGLKAALLLDNNADLVVNVEVLNGLHKGSKADLKASNLVIGSDTDHDIMLVDDEVLGSAIHVRCCRSLFGTLLTVTTDRDDISLNGKSVRPNDQTVTERLPCELTINGISMRFCALNGGQIAKSVAPDQVALVALVAVAVAAFSGQAYLDSQSPSQGIVLNQSPSEQQSAGTTPDITLATASDVSSVAEPVEETERDPAAIIRETVKDAGMANFVEVAPTPSGIILISGQVPPERMSEWRQVRQEIDTKTAENIVIADVTETKSLTDLPPIAAVNLGSDPKVIFANGIVSRVGDRVVDDWAIASISQDSLQLRRHDEAIDVSF